jgi:hypothetical protein
MTTAQNPSKAFQRAAGSWTPEAGPNARHLASCAVPGLVSSYPPLRNSRSHEGSSSGVSMTFGSSDLLAPLGRSGRPSTCWGLVRPNDGSGRWTRARTRGISACTEPMDEFSSASMCVCGQPLPTHARGRPRHSCSPTCKRYRDRVLRKVERRHRWIAQWHAEVGQRSQAEITAAIIALDAEIRDLLATLHQAPGAHAEA